jgi:hypothetical protein
MTTDRALDLALEALEYIHEGAKNQGPHTGISWRCVAVKAEPAIKAIKQARALDKKAENARELGLDYEPAQQEPVAWRTFDGEGGYDYRTYDMNEDYAKEWNERNPTHKGWVEPLYTTPPAQPAPVQPVAWAIYQRGRLQSFWLDKGDAYDFEFTTEHQWQPLYTTPPAQRTWEEWFKWWRTSKVADSTEAEIDFADFMLIVRAVESEYGIKEQK